MHTLLDRFGLSFSPQFGVADVFDILVVTFGIFFLLRLVQGTRAVQLIKGFVAVAFVVLVTGADYLNLKATHWVLSVILQNWVVTLIILFQPELRLVIEQVGRGKFLREAFRPSASQDIVTVINEVVRAARRLSEKKIGALVALERQVGLNDIISTGRRINGAVSSELLQTVFHPGGPMHDGGVVVQNNQVTAAMCLFPLTSRDTGPRSYGTRHRAAIGLSEVTDAVVVVISEETGAISLAVEGQLVSNLSVGALKEKLLALLPAGTENARPFWRRETPRPREQEPASTSGGEGHP
jgi:diadenylate cyclase